MNGHLTGIIECADGDGHVASYSKVDVISRRTMMAGAGDDIEETRSPFFKTASAPDVDGRPPRP